MKLNVAAQIKMPGNAGAFQLAEEWPQIEYGGRMIEFASQIHVALTCIYDGEGFTVEGEIDTSLKSECAKCTKSFVEPFSVQFRERFEKVADEDEGIYGYRGDELDLTTMIRDAILLNLPISSVCSKDCKGLCPVCGCDRNIAQCDCVIEETKPVEDTRRSLSALSVLLNEDKEV